MKIKKLNEDIQHCWFGYYIDKDGNQKYFYMTKDSTSKDPDEASDIMEDSIPEPFTKFVFQGSVANTQAEKQGMKLVESKSINESIEVATIADYITDHYKFETIDDKYSCIDSIKDSFKDEKTISKEELEQFIGSHNGKDKVNESKSISGSIKVGDNVKVNTPGNDFYNGRTGVVDYTEDGIVTVIFNDDKSPKMNNFDLNQVTRIDEAKSINENVDVNDIAHYIIDNYEFDDMQDKYDCINSLRASFKFDKTISKEDIEDFVGAHNGRDKVNENLNEADAPLYIIKDRNGNQLSAPNPNDDELWDRVSSMEARGRTGLSVVAYVDKTNKSEGPYIKLSDPQAYIDELDFAGAVEIKGNKIYADEETLRQLAGAIAAEYGWSVSINEALNEASYGGAFDIEDDQYFTRDDIEDAAEYVIDHINETFDDRFVLGGTWFENNTWTVNVQTEDGMEEYEKSMHIDMRKIKAPRDLKDKFNIDMAARLIKDIKELKYDIHEDFDGDITDTFIADGEEYEWIDKRITRHDTKDSQGFAEEWFIASAKSLEDGETYYFIIDDSDFVDWGPCYTFDEAQEFLIAKDSDYDDMDESLKESVTSDAEPIENGPKVGMASIISDLIKDEYEAIDGYNAAIATAEAEGFEDAIKVLTEIQAEENIHIGQLQEVMKLFDPNADKVEDGQAEGAEQLANSIATDDINEELETEDSVFNKFVEIEKDLNDGEAVTAVIDKMVADNKGNPTYEKAYHKWLNK